MQLERSREVRLARRPKGLPVPEDFELKSIRLFPLSAGEVRVRNTWMSVDPYMRGRMHKLNSYLPAFKLGEALTGYAVGEVIASRSDLFKPGATVLSFNGWREAFNAKAEDLEGVDTELLPAETYLGVAGLPGLTAWVAFNRFCKVEPDDVVFVSAAAGAVGSVACQIAKLRGARVIGSAGGAHKCDFLRTIGVDVAIDYKAVASLEQALKQAAPDGIDVYFDNVGGEQLNAAIAAAKRMARFVICGAISGYNGQPVEAMNRVLSFYKLIKYYPVLVSDHFDLKPSFLADISPKIRSGAVQQAQTVEIGLESAVGAFIGLFAGANIGKMLVKLTD